MVGTEIGNYRILDKLGEGVKGVVYKAVDINLDRPVALRALNIDLNGDPELEQRFRAEVKPLGNLNNTNLPALYTLLVEQGRPWMVLEFIEGETFEQMVRRRGPIPSEEAIPLFRQVLWGVGYAHRMGVVHRDIKPANIMLNRQGVVKVMDFGIAKILSTRGMSRAGTRIGTPSYMSPEQFLNRGVDSRSDIYSLGVTLYEMLTAKPPFSAENDYQVMSDHVNTPPPPLTHFFPHVPKATEQAVLKALEKSPDVRYQSAEEFSAAVSNSQGLAVSAPAVSAPAAAIPSVAPAVAAPVTAAGTTGHVPMPLRGSFLPAASRFSATREQKMVAAALVAILVLAGVLLGLRIKERRAAAQTASTASAAAQNAANNAPAPPDANAPPPASDNGAVPAPGDVPANGVAVAPAQPDAAADAGAVPQGLTIPAGTVIAVRMVDPVSSSTNQAGQSFGASVDADVVVNGAVAIPSGSDAGVALIKVAQVPVAERSDVQLELVRLNINGTNYRARSSIFEQQSLPRTKKSVAAAGARAAFGALGGVLNHGSAGDGAAAGAASAFIVYIAPQTRIAFKLRRDIAVSQ